MIQLVKVKPIASPPAPAPAKPTQSRGRETITSLDLEPIPLLIQPVVMFLCGLIPL